MFLLLMQLASAATLIKGGWMYSGEGVAVETTSLLMIMSRTEVAADYGTGFLSIKNNSCSYADYIKVCVDNIEYNHITDKIRAYVRVYKRVPTLKITRTFSGDTLLINENSTVSVTIENTGDVIAKNVVYADYFPKEVVISDAEGGSKISGSVVTWKGEIKAGNTVELTYKIKPTEEFDASLKAEATFFNGFTTKTTYSDAKRIKASTFFTITPIVSRTRFSIGEKINMSVNLSNREFYAVNVDYLDVTVDKDLEVLEVPSPLKKIGDYTYRWAGRLPGAGSVNVSNGTTYTRYNVTSLQLRYKFKAKRAPSANIYFKARYTDKYGVTRDTKQIKQSFTIDNKGVKISSNMEDITLESFQKKKMIVWLQNLNTYAAIKNVYVNISSFLYLPNLFYKEISRMEHKRVVEKIIYAPQVTTSTGHKIVANVSYQTEFGDNYSYTYTTTFTVIPVKGLLITKTLTKSALESGETTTVTVSVKNQRKVKVNNVMISEDLPPELTVSGMTSRKVSINAEDTLTAYSYTITAPKVNETRQYSAITNVRYTSKNITDSSSSEMTYTYSKNTSFTVKPKQLALSVLKQIPDSAIYAGEIVDVNYRISNPSTDQTANNIVVLFPLQQEFDLLSPARSYTVGTLGPGETVYVNGEEKIRPKYNQTTLTVAKTRVEYENQDGARFHANSTTISLSIIGAYEKGPYIVAYKEVPAQANNTDEFLVNVTLSNVGSEEVFVNASDTIKSWSTKLKPNANKSFTYKTKIKKVGKFELPQVVAQYTYQNNTFLTGSNKPVIEIISRPLLSIEKVVPERVNIFDEFLVLLNVKNLIDDALSNVTILDAGHKWFLSSFTGEKVLNYSTALSQVGEAVLESATATYWFDQVPYSAESETKKVLVIEEQVLLLEKNVSKSQVNQSEVFTVRIKVVNKENVSITDIIVTDGNKTWSIDLGAGKEKTLTYTTFLEEVKRHTLPAASATYVYKEKNKTTVSNTVDVEVSEFAASIEVEVPAKAPEGVVAKILYYLKKILTWRR
jgi:hypothetical protein